MLELKKVASNGSFIERSRIGRMHGSALPYYSELPSFLSPRRSMRDLSPVGLQSELDLDQLRARLRRMTDAELRHFRQSARFMCSPAANHGAAQRECFVIQLGEARAE